MSDDELAKVQRRIESLTVAITLRSIPRIVGPLLHTTLTIQQLKTLTTLVTTDGMTTSDLAQEFEVSMASMSKLLDRLVERDLVERRADASDQRIRRIHLTGLGRAVVGEILGARPELGMDVLRGLSVDELLALETGLRAVNRELQSFEP